jgi:hypothetical protein
MDQSQPADRGGADRAIIPLRTLILCLIVVK